MFGENAMTVISVSQLVQEGASHADKDVEVVGWVVDRFEHRAIYGTETDAVDQCHRRGIWMAGSLPQRQTVRGDGPLHGLHVKVRGRFHHQPRSGAGHMGLFPAWIGVKTYEVLDQIAETGCTESRDDLVVPNVTAPARDR